MGVAVILRRFLNGQLQQGQILGTGFFRIRMVVELHSLHRNSLFLTITLPGQYFVDRVCPTVTMANMYFVQPEHAAL